MKEFWDQLEEVMHSRNFYIKGNINYNLTGKFQRFSNAENYKRKKDLFVILHDYDRGATFGDWHYPEDWFTYWNENYDSPGIAELKKIKAELIIIKAKDDYRRSRAEWRSRELWLKYYVSHDPKLHPYIIKKKIIPYYARQIRSWLLIPISNIDHELVTLQIIKPDGFKRLWKGTSQKSLCIWLWDKLPDNYSGVIRICEGYATGCTIREITRNPVVCGINSLNMIKVCIELRRKFIHSIIKICADNDKWGKENIGIKHALDASKFTGAKVYYPIFEKNTKNTYIHNPTDFNDLFICQGKNEVKNQLLINRN